MSTIQSIDHWQYGWDQGEEFSHCLATEDSTEGLPRVQKLILYYKRDSGGLSALSITYNNGKSSPVFGDTKDTNHQKTFNVHDGEIIKSMWQGHDGVSRMGQIKIVSNEKTWEGGPYNPKVLTPVSVHGGILLGISGRFDGDHIYKLGYYFLEDLASISIRFDYLTTPDPASIQLVEYDWVEGDNRELKDANLSISLDYGEDVTNEFSTNEEWTESTSESVEVSVGFWGIGGGASAEWSESRTTGSSTSESKSQHLNWNGSIPVPPGKYYRVDMYYSTGTYDIEYKATIVLNGKSGSKSTIYRYGRQKGMAGGGAKYVTSDLTDTKQAVSKPRPTDNALSPEDLPPNSK